MQNAVDALYQRKFDLGEPAYEPRLWIQLDLAAQLITVCDNGIGITPEQFRRVLAPNVSFKDYRTTGSRRYRGHKGVGLAYLAYGFNRIRITSRTEPTSIVGGEMLGGRKWVTGASESPPSVEPAAEPYDIFETLDRGTVVSVQLDESTTPKSLARLAFSPEAWVGIIRTQTAAGRVFNGDGKDLEIRGTLTVLATGEPPRTVDFDTEYLFPHRFDDGRFKYLDLPKYYKEHPNTHRVTFQFKQKNGIYLFWDTKALIEALGADATTEEARRVVEERSGWAYGFMASSTEFFDDARPAADDPRSRLLSSGVAIASDNMVIGDFREISLTRYIGRQQQLSCIVHLENLRPDLGRKSFEKEIEGTAQRVAQRVALFFGQGERFKEFLRPPSTKPTSITKDRDLQDWIIESREWAKSNALHWKGKAIGLVSEPRQEQDVVILFSQLVGAGLLPGYTIYGTAEGNRQYDSLAQVQLTRTESTIFGREQPQGIASGAFDFTGNIDSKVMVVEFKYRLDDLVRDFQDESKVFRDVEVAIAWSAGGSFKEGVMGDYVLRSLSTEETYTHRPFPGVTHQLFRTGTEDQVWVILLEDLFELANDWDKAQGRQLSRYADA